MENRRQFTRILFAIDAQLIIDDQRYLVSIHDISLNGALVSHPCFGDSFIKKIGTLTFELIDNERVEMHVAVMHESENELGLRCNAMDIDSMSHLRRMIELNLGDDSQLHKELSQLTRVDHQ
ncbi:PilZ domain-containing protein [Thalassotalea sp. LPB0316]|uniref:PilZ domain-containing protein n=1 Tax=Thalassotalea sp. LPB0316 TaxID=2769490 RepID=UPI001866FA48|nr:PilZ domain-containing protein [Thalassotalea sp. LPB0316]QOL27018.1 PilZ domain-containing protein [Thalassotalea sp. LPB0316]